MSLFPERLPTPAEMPIGILSGLDDHEALFSAFCFLLSAFCPLTSSFGILPSGRQRHHPSLLQAADGKAVSAADAGFFDNVLEVDFHRAGTDTEFDGDLFVFEALFH